MEDYYIVEYFGKRFTVIFSTDIEFIPTFRKITHCTIIEEPGKHIYAGATIRNPNDNGNIWIARRWALKRALFYLWMIWADDNTTDLPFQSFWQLFRKALAENELYLKDRKENK
jgi:hypothetical protein